MADLKAYTSVYQFPYPLAGDSVQNTYSRIQELAQRIETTYTILDIDLSGSAKLMQEGDPAGGELTGSYPDPDIASGVIDNDNVNASAGIVYSKLNLNNSIVAADLTNNSVTTGKINDDAVTSAKIAVDAVGSSELANNAVDTAAIQNNAVTTAKILDDAVTDAKLANNAVDTSAIQDSAVTSDKLGVVALKNNSTAVTQPQSDGSTKVATTAYVDAYIAGTVPANSIDTNELADGAVTNAKVNATAGIEYTKLDLIDSIVDADVNSAAAISDTKLDTISTAGKVDNSATTGTETSTPDTLVLRDANADFDASLIGVRGVKFDTLTPEADDEARLVWSPDDGSLLLGLEGGAVQLPLGQKQVIYAKNGTGVTIPKMSAIMAVGAAGDRISIDLAVADGTIDASYMLGVAAESILDDTLGYIVTNGYVRNVNTNTWPVGTVLYFDPNTPGGLTTVEPSAPDLNLPIAIVTKQNSSSGILYIRMKNGEYLKEIHDVKIDGITLADGDVLKYNATLGVWENVPSDDIELHASTHELGGTDEVALDPTQITGIAVIDTDARLTDSRTPSGTAGGDLSGSYPSPALVNAGTAGTYTKVTTDAKGRVSSGTTLGESDIPSLSPSKITGTAVITTDARLSDARTPTSHATTHDPGGTDALDLAKIISVGSILPTLPDVLYPAGALFGLGAAAPYLLHRSTGSVWDQIGGAGGSIDVSDTAPTTPNSGDLWYDSTTGKTFIWYEDGTSDQWVEVGANAQIVIPQHGASHVRGGVDVIDGDRLSVDYVPTAYTRNSAASGAGDVTDLTAHLGGLNQMLAIFNNYQYKQVTNQDGIVNVFNTWTDIVPGGDPLSVTITPILNTNKVRVKVQAILGVSAGNTVAIRVLRGTTPVGVGVVDGSRPGVSSAEYINDNGRQGILTVEFIDTPNTTSAVTYKVQTIFLISGTCTVYANRTGSDANSVSNPRTLSFISAQELL